MKLILNEYFARFEATRIEVGTGNGYRWADGVYIIKPNGDKLYPPMLISEARAICKREGWPIVEPNRDSNWLDTI